MKNNKKENSMETEQRDGFIFYRSFFETLETMGDKNRLKAYDVIMKYGFNGDIPKDLSPMILRVFTMAKPQIDANRRKHLNKVRRNAQVGSKETDTSSIKPFGEEIPLIKIGKDSDELED